MNPADYGISVYSPEAAVALGAEELLYKVGKEALHAEGEVTKEYLAMLSLYAVNYVLKHSCEDTLPNKFALITQEYFDPDNMSDALVKYLTDLLAK